MSCPRCINEMILWPCPHKEPMKFNLPTRDEDKEPFHMLDHEIKKYIEKLCSEKDSLIARYVMETGNKVSDICLVERDTPTGRIFYPDLKSKHFEEKK